MWKEFSLNHMLPKSNANAWLSDMVANQEMWDGVLLANIF